ncbi:MOSC domain-containing protein [Pseudoruegeria sp. HB172150]|uniref:MOSC domain-containing protein n=1 Tax=Pseudoruegeria sp. HB172150 TaxID=2721164 RepID=UPI001552866E|nr:MOSC domain-containing protein [Pseudoruegeria sp. HB172150]
MAHRTMDELKAALPEIEAAPKEGVIRAIVVRPSSGMREMPESAEMSLARGMHGDHWEKGCWLSTEDGQPHPDVQICMMPARMIAAIAGEDTAAWGPAGDNLFIDMDLSPANCPPGTRLSMGSVELEITGVPHNGCESFIERYGRDACVFVNTGTGKAMRLRGIYGRVVKDGAVAVGDAVRKIG